MRKGFWLTLILLGIIGAVSGGIFAEAYTRDYRLRAGTYDLERINELEEPSIILDRNGKEIGRIFVQNRSVIPIEQVPEIFIKTLRAGEDSRFLTHHGVDYIGIVRAGILNAQGGNQGASTITQQLARNAYNLKEEAKQRKETTIQRKLVEAFLARRIEDRYTKEQILNFYLNRIYFGSGFYGIRSASLGYFGKEPMKLTTEECASLVTLIKNPNARSPLNNPEVNRTGRNYVLGRMREEGFISSSELARLRALPLRLNSQPLRRGTTHLYERIAEAVGLALGEDALASGKFKVHTTILAEAQNAAQQALLDSLEKAEAQPGYTHPKYRDYRKGSPKPAEYLQGAVLMIDHDTGEVLAHVGGRDYAQVPYDFIELGKRPLGTAFFPYIYAAGLSGGQTPASLVEDEPMDNRAVMVGGREGILGEWGMEVSSPVYEGKIPVRKALENSKIAATVRFAGATGLQRVVDTAVSFGLPLQKAELLPRLAVGFEEVSMKQAVRAMTTFPRGGQSGPEKLVYLDRVENSQGRVVYRRQRQPQPTRDVIDEATAWQVHSMMVGSLFRGSSKGVLDGMLEKNFSGAGKSGTTHDFADTWFIGYNKRVTCGVWTGFLGNDGAIYPGAFGRDLSMPVWQKTMNAAAPSFGGGQLTPPDSVVEVNVCTVSGERATQFCQQHEENVNTGMIQSRSTAVGEYFRRGTEKLPFCSIHSGGTSEGGAPDITALNLPALDAVPVRPKEPTLIGDDPYHTEVPSFAATSAEGGFVRHRTNVLDSLDLTDIEDGIPLPRPRRLQIDDE
ncbi:transglycosylase domain-containing protein [Luteolibacter yonseiensis]|uniref:Transglycosylase domain-containing protein n=1 Tax=Luteolibacter yonseiensis TaxID=1144680 RepID=A0A934R0Q0_9BACT|nr:transglycosylase domain-containing protein [Luteolibacter yonseiensis]MBK1814602.1 transglycosylase domain-containing protein [Luteolibacter yonseiensis]